MKKQGKLPLKRLDDHPMDCDTVRNLIQEISFLKKWDINMFLKHITSSNHFSHYHNSNCSMWAKDFLEFMISTGPYSGITNQFYLLLIQCLKSKFPVEYNRFMCSSKKKASGTTCAIQYPMYLDVTNDSKEEDFQKPDFVIDLTSGNEVSLLLSSDHWLEPFREVLVESILLPPCYPHISSNISSTNSFPTPITIPTPIPIPITKNNMMYFPNNRTLTSDITIAQIQAIPLPTTTQPQPTNYLLSLEQIEYMRQQIKAYVNLPGMNYTRFAGILGCNYRTLRLFLITPTTTTSLKRNSKVYSSAYDYFERVRLYLLRKEQ